MENKYFSIIQKEEVNPFLSNEIEENLNEVKNILSGDDEFNKVLFIGEKGTGKRKSAIELSNQLGKMIYSVNLDLLNCKTVYNKVRKIKEIFNEINNISNFNKVIVLFDNIDQILFDKFKKNKKILFTLKESLNEINKDIIITSKTINIFDNDFLELFKKVVDFNNYSINFLFSIADLIIKNKIEKTNFLENKELLRKILMLSFPIVTPEVLLDLLNKSFELCNKNKPYDYLRILYSNIKKHKDDEDEIISLYDDWFSIEEIEILTGIVKEEIEKRVRR